MKRAAAHILSATTALVFLAMRLWETTDGVMLLWFVPNMAAVCVVIALTLGNLRNKPSRTEDSPMMFGAAMLSTNFCILIALFGHLFPLYQTAPSASVQGAGALLNLLSMPFYLAAVLSLGRGFAILPEAHTLQTGGLYKISRHPIYLTYLFWCATQNLIYQTWTVLGFSVVQTILFLYRAKQEEKVLTLTFPAYEEYRNRVMWLGTRTT